MENTREFEIHWLEDIKKEILERAQDIYVLSTGKTPSGSIHVGILREITICDCLARLLKDEGKAVKFFLFFDSLDAAKKFPDYIPKDFKVHLGKPFSDIPCPVKECGCESYAHHWGNELVSTFDTFGIHPEIKWSHELYNTPDMKGQIRKALDNTAIIREIILKNILPTLDEGSQESYREQMKSWYPAMVICEKCGTTQFNDKKKGKILANRIVEYDSTVGEVVYECPNPACNNTARVSLDEVRVKLNWRVDWPAKWDLFKTTCEPAGKDHATKGGSYDTGLELCQAVFGYQGPIKVPYEWLRLGDQDMSTSGGIVFNPREYLKIGGLPEAFRHIIVKTRPTTHISLRIENLPLVFDEYERFEKIYFGHEDVPEEKQITEYMYPLTQVGSLPTKIPGRVPFRYLVVMSQLQELLDDQLVFEKCNEVRRRTTPRENIEDLSIKELKVQLNRAKYWVDHYAPKTYQFNVEKTLPQSVKDSLTDIEKAALSRIQDLLKSNRFSDEQEIQNAIFGIAKDDLGVKPGQVFGAVYKVFLGKKSGPRLGPFLMAMDDAFVQARLDEALS